MSSIPPTEPSSSENEIVDVVFLEQLETRYKQEIAHIREKSPYTRFKYSKYGLMVKIPLHIGRFINRHILHRNIVYMKGMLRDYYFYKLSQEEVIDENLKKLNIELSKVQEELENIKSANKPIIKHLHSPTKEDCEHWRELHNVHIRFIRELELKNAKMGLNTPIHEIIDLEERQQRVAKLQADIQQHCAE